MKVCRPLIALATTNERNDIQTIEPKGKFIRNHSNRFSDHPYVNQSSVILTKRYIFFEHLDAENGQRMPTRMMIYHFPVYRIKAVKRHKLWIIRRDYKTVVPNQPSSFVPGYDPAVEATFLGFGPTFIIDPPVRSCTSIIPPILCHRESNNSVREVFPGSLNPLTRFVDNLSDYPIDILTNPINGSRRDKNELEWN